MLTYWPKVIVLVLASVLLAGCSFLQRSPTAGLQVITDNMSSSLFLDGQYLDKTALINKSIKPGQYTLRIEPDDLELAPYETQVMLRAKLLTVVTWKPGPTPETSGGVIYEMEPIKSNQGELSFITQPDNTIIKLDNGGKQFSPLTIKNLEPGHHQFEISLPSYEKQAHTINVIKGHRTTITAKLAKALPSQTEPNPSASPPSASDSANSNLKNSIKILPTNFSQDGVEVLRVRNQATISAQTLGFAPVGQTYPRLEGVKNGWYQIEFNQQPGWVSAEYAQPISADADLDTN